MTEADFLLSRASSHSITLQPLFFIVATIPSLKACPSSGNVKKIVFLQFLASQLPYTSIYRDSKMQKHVAGINSTDAHQAVM